MNDLLSVYIVTVFEKNVKTVRYFFPGTGTQPRYYRRTKLS